MPSLFSVWAPRLSTCLLSVSSAIFVVKGIAGGSPYLSAGIIWVCAGPRPDRRLSLADSVQCCGFSLVRRIGGAEVSDAKRVDDCFGLYELDGWQSVKDFFEIALRAAGDSLVWRGANCVLTIGLWELATS